MADKMSWNKANKVSSKLRMVRLRARQPIDFIIAAWEAIQKQFGKMIKQVGRQTARIKDRAQARALQSRQPNLQI